MQAPLTFTSLTSYRRSELADADQIDTEITVYEISRSETSEIALSRDFRIRDTRNLHELLKSGMTTGASARNYQSSPVL